MVMQRTSLFYPRIGLMILILLHIMGWTLAPILVRLNLPMDSIENTIWAEHLAWGYDKNPFMNSALTWLALALDHHNGWMLYLFSQLMVGITFWAVWQLGKEIIPPVYALLSVILLEGMQYYHFHAIDFSDNTIELAMWSLTILFFYHALKTNQIRYWLGTGLFAGLGMMTKYYTAILLLAMALFLIFNRDARLRLKQSHIYWGLAVFILTILPNLIWLITHDFMTIRYAFIRTQSEPHWFNHFYYPLQFAWQQLLVFMPTLFLWGMLFLGKRNSAAISVSSWDKSFLLYVGFGPFLLTLLLACSMGFQLHGAWGQPLLTLWAMILIVIYPPSVSLQKCSVFLTVILSLLLLMIITYSVTLLQAKKTSSAIFPGKDIAEALTNDWNQRYHVPLKYIAGSRWLSGNIAFYSKDHPTVYIDWNHQLSEQINEMDVRQNGAIFVWDLSEVQNATPDEIKQRFPQMSVIETKQFAWKRNPTLTPSVTFLIAYLPPAKSNH